jgi:hypothetical protein
MKNIKQLLFLTVIALTVMSCGKDSDPVPEPEHVYSFFVAGHTYGKPGTHDIGFYPLFRNEFDAIRSYPDMTFGVLTGDIVQHSDEESWDTIDRELELLDLPVYFAPGNHDTYNYELYKQRYGDPEHNYRTYGTFSQDKDVFILLDANLDNWNISGDQLMFLQEVLDENRGKVNHVFVFIHQLIWWDDDNEFKNIVINWPPYTPDTTNYWGTVEPLFQNYPAPVIFFAGDLGATEPATPYMYYQSNNITYIAGGMGTGINDNYLFVTVNSKGTVEYDLIALQGDRHRFGKLEDYILP